MTSLHDTWLARRRARWVRSNAQLFMRPDAARFLQLGAQRHLRPGLKNRVLPEFRDWFGLVPEGKANFNPSQPRVPKGNPDGGQWTDASGSSGGEAGRAGRNDPRVISDATPDNEWRPGAQYASNAPRGPYSGYGPIYVNGRPAVGTPGQQAALAAAEARAQLAISRVQEILPRWKPSFGFYDTINGRIEHAKSQAQQAESYYREMQNYGIIPGPFAGGSIPARGPERHFTAAEIRANNSHGAMSGCHICGTSNPGTRSGNWGMDHQPPSSVNSRRLPQRLFPTCMGCSSGQGGWLSNYLRTRE
jgi:hypothetical protein